MANIAYNATANGTAASTSLTIAHTCTGSNLILLVGVLVTTTETDVITGVTYNSIAMTRVTTHGLVVNAGLGSSMYFYYLIAPSTGANNIVITASASHTLRGVSTSYTGVRQASQPDAANSGTADVANTITTSVTTVANNCWTVSISYNDSDFPAASTGLTERTQSSIFGIGDSNAAITPAGAYAMTWDTESAGSVSWGMAAVSIAPVPEGGAALFAA